jgi:hypothetical protein
MGERQPPRQMTPPEEDRRRSPEEIKARLHEVLLLAFQRPTTAEEANKVNRARATWFALKWVIRDTDEAELDWVEAALLKLGPEARTIFPRTAGEPGDRPPEQEVAEHLYMILRTSGKLEPPAIHAIANRLADLAADAHPLAPYLCIHCREQVTDPHQCPANR